MSAKPLPNRAAVVDHRARVGKAKRARTQARIYAAALQVFAEKGPDAPIIEDFIKAAGVARGTFYNYFKTMDELRVATSKWLEDNLMLSIEAEIGELESPVERFATGVRLWLRRCREDAEFSAFIVRNNYRGELVERQLTRDLRAAQRTGQFSLQSVEVARDLAIGTIREAMARMLSRRVPRSYPDDITRTILRGLGLDERSSSQVLSLPLPAMQQLPRRSS